MLENLKTKIAKFLSGTKDSKAFLYSDVDVNTSKNDSSSRAIGAGQTSGIHSKRSNITIDNSTTNNIYLTLPSLNNASPEELASIQKQLLQVFQNGDLQFLNDTAANNLDGYNAFEKSDTSKDMITYFAGRIPPEDLLLLRTGLYIKYLVEKDNYDRAMQIKENAIKDRHSRNVINLATAGYFETYIKPIFENNDSETAEKEYQEVVRFLPEIIFVNNSMQAEDIFFEVEEKIAEKERYHMSVRAIMVNGIGKQCAQNISETEPLLREKYPEYGISITKNESNKLIHCKMQITLSKPRS